MWHRRGLVGIKIRRKVLGGNLLLFMPHAGCPDYDWAVYIR